MYLLGILGILFVNVLFVVQILTFAGNNWQGWNLKSVIL